VGFIFPIFLPYLFSTIGGNVQQMLFVTNNTLNVKFTLCSAGAYYFGTLWLIIHTRQGNIYGFSYWLFLEAFYNL
jgi:hypothetical protein